MNFTNQKVNGLSAEEIIELLNLKTLEIEGGFFRETYRSALTLPGEALPNEYGGPRSSSTCIFYLLSAGDFSAIHKVKSDEIFHFYLGCSVRMLRLYPDGSSDEIILGSKILKGQNPLVIVPGGVWQGCIPENNTGFALMGCTVSPGFDYADFTLGNRYELIKLYPERRELIKKLTKDSIH